MKVELVRYTENPHEAIELAASNCYDSIPNGKIMGACYKSGHHSVLEFAQFHFHIEGVSRACYDKDTMVLTNNGWKYFKDIDINSDTFCSINENNEIEYVKASKQISYKYEGKLDTYKSTQIDLCVTPNHNMWVFDYHKRSPKSKIWKFIKSENLTNGRYGFEKSSKGVITKNCESIIIPSVKRNHHPEFTGYTFKGEKINLFLELLGIWVTDGSLSFGTNKNGVHTSGNKINISQTKQFGRDKIEQLLSALNIKYKYYTNSYHIYNQPLFDWLASNFIKGKDTHKTYYLSLPRWMFTDLSVDNMKHFLYGVFIGNGSHHTYTHEELISKNISIFKTGSGFNIYTGSEAFANDLVEMALLCGLCGNKRLPKIRNRIFPNTNRLSYCKQSYIVSILTQGFHLFNTKPNKSQIDYNDMVYCVELEKYHKLYVMRNGRAVWCGNCSHQLVRHRTASFAQRSQRYCREDGFEIVCPMSIVKNEEAMKVYSEFHKLVQEVYDKLQGYNIPNEDARYVLPNACCTTIDVSMDFRNLCHFMNERLCSRAQWEIRELANKMKDEVIKVFPEARSMLVPKCERFEYPFCPEAKSCGRHDTLKKIMNKG